MSTRTALLVIDMQEAVRLGGTPALDLAGVLNRLNAAMEVVRRSGGAVVFLRHEEPGGAWARSGPGWPLMSELAQMADDIVIDKASCDGFRATKLAHALETLGAQHLLVGGYASDFCVDSTVRAAASHGFEVTVLADAHTTRDRPHVLAPVLVAHQNWVWGEITNPGARIVVRTTADVLTSDIL
jgi:nicotinamidase-related amidase